MIDPNTAEGHDKLIGFYMALLAILVFALFAVIGLASCATTPPSPTEDYTDTILATPAPATLVLQRYTVVLGEYHYTTGPTQIRLVLTDDARTPLRIDFGRSEITAATDGGEMHISYPFKDTLQPQETETYTIAPQINLHANTTPLLSGLMQLTSKQRPTASDFYIAPMPNAPIIVTLVYNDTVGFSGPDKTLAITITPRPAAGG